MNASCIEFIHDLHWQAIPAAAQQMARQCVLDLIGVAASGTQTDLSRMINDHVIQHFAIGSL